MLHRKDIVERDPLVQAHQAEEDNGAGNEDTAGNWGFLYIHNATRKHAVIYRYNM